MSGSGSAGAGAGAALQVALVGAVATTGVRAFDAPPVRGAVPYAVVEPPLLFSRDAAGCAGAEGRVTVTVHDEGERPERLWRLIAGVEAALAAAMPELSGGWRLIVGQVGTGRVRRGERGGSAPLRWTAAVEMRVRLFRVHRVEGGE